MYLRIYDICTYYCPVKELLAPFGAKRPNSGTDRLKSHLHVTYCTTTYLYTIPISVLITETIFRPPALFEVRSRLRALEPQEFVPRDSRLSLSTAELCGPGLVFYLPRAGPCLYSCSLCFPLKHPCLRASLHPSLAPSLLLSSVSSCVWIHPCL